MIFLRPLTKGTKKVSQLLESFCSDWEGATSNGVFEGVNFDTHLVSDWVLLQRVCCGTVEPC